MYDTEYNHCRVEFANILPKLFMEIADPQLPSSKGIFSFLFSSSYHCVIDREELCKFTVYLCNNNLCVYGVCECYGSILWYAPRGCCVCTYMCPECLSTCSD